jgi:hypothetical protein
MPFSSSSSLSVQTSSWSMLFLSVKKY